MRCIYGARVQSGGGGRVRRGGTECFILSPDINSGPDLACGRLR